jgi:hypothetical protein
MGMDVIGRAPTSERGKYFENNSSWWHPLATYCKEVAPEIARGCRHWHTNSGDGLDAAASRALAEALEAEIESGRCLDIERQAEAEREAAPKEICPICHGKGVVWRTRPQPTVNLYGEVEFAPLYITDADDPRIDDGAGMPCFACNGRGFHRPSFTSPFSVKNVRNFAAFLRDCGGFAIL